MVSRYHRKRAVSPSLSSNAIEIASQKSLLVPQGTLLSFMTEELVLLANEGTKESLLVDLLAKGYNIHQLPESTDYFFKKCDQVLNKDYIPNDEGKR